jgi:hypothetical protein
MTTRGDVPATLTGTVHDLAPILIERVTTADARLLFRELVGRHHYLGHRVPYGAHVRYLIYATRLQRQVVACVQFSSAAWRMVPRDAWIGWDDATRVRNLPRILNNSRFLVVPWISAKNLASTILARVARQVAADWATVYGVRPVLLETLVDPRRFDGTCYRAANWIILGTTTGRGRNDQHRRNGRVPKRVLIYPLVPDAAARLRGD